MLLTRYDAAQATMSKTGLAGQQAHEAVMRQLTSRTCKIPWAELSRTQRKTQWVHCCSVFVKCLERLLKRAEKINALAAKEKAAIKLNRLARKRRLGKARHWRARVCVAIPRALAEPVARKVRKFLIDTPAPKRPVLRTRSRSRLVHYVAEVSEAIEERRRAIATERRQRHIDFQELRSQRRARLFRMRVIWLRHTEERTAASDDLWQHAQEEEEDNGASLAQDLGAWPRLEKRQRERLAEEVEAFVRGPQ